MTPSKLFLAGLFSLAMLASPACFADSVADTPDAAVRSTFDKVGEAIVSLPLLNEARPSTSARYYVYMCSAGWCPPSHRAMASAVKAYEDMKKTALVEILHIDYSRSEEEARKFIGEHGVKFPATMSRNASVLPGFGNPGYIPSIIIVDAFGNVVKSGHGSIIKDWKSLITAYEKEKGLPLSFPETVVLTCTPRMVLADAEMADEERNADDDKAEKPAGKPTRKASSKVGKALAGLTSLTDNEPNLRAKHYIYLCSAGWCGPCNAEMPHVVAAYEAMQKSNTELILVSFDHSQDAARGFVEKYGAEFPVIMKDQAADLPGIKMPRGIPFCCIVDAKGKLLHSGHGSAAVEWYKYTGGKAPKVKKDKKSRSK